MAKKAYIGVGGKAKKINKIYIGVGNVARKVKKAYVGIGGKAKQFWPSGLQQYGQVSSALNAYAPYLAGTSVGDYALFGGGEGITVGSSSNQFEPLAYVNYYNKSLTRSLAENLSTARSRLAAATVGNCAFFGGGCKGTSVFATVDVYDASTLARTSPTSVLKAATCDLVATSAGNYVLFGGGRTHPSAEQGSFTSKSVTAYDASKTRYSPSDLNYAIYLGAATSVGKYALFGGGKYDANVHPYEVTAYDASSNSLTKKSTSGLSYPRSEVCATTINGYALFAGGFNGSYQNIVDTFNADLTRSTIAPLAMARNALKAVTLGDEYALIAGGYNGDYVGTVDVYDKNLTHTTTNDMIHGRRDHAMATVGEYALIAGGQYGAGISSNVEAYCI